MSKKQKEIDNLLERLEYVGKIQNEIMKKFEELKRLHQMELKVKDVEYNELKERFQAHKEADCKTIQEQSDLIVVLEKALELACDKIGDVFGSNYQDAWFFADVGNSIITRECFEEYFKIKAKEMMKSE